MANEKSIEVQRGDIVTDLSETFASEPVRVRLQRNGNLYVCLGFHAYPEGNTERMLRKS